MLWANNPFITGMSFINEADEDEEGKPSFTPPASDNDANPDDTDYTLDDGTDDEGNDPNEPQPQSEEPEGSDDSENGDGTDESSGGDDEDYTLDDGTDDEGNTQSDDASDNEDSQEENQKESDNPDNGDTGDDEDYSLDDGTDDEGNDDPQSDDTSDNEDSSKNSEGADNDDSGEVDPRQKLRDLENSIFDQLSDDQKASKTKELKGLFNSTYFNCQKIINNIDHVQKTPDTVKVYDYVTMTLNDLMKYIKDYLQDTFDNRTYMENVVEFEKYLSILDSIKKIFIELKTASNDSE